MALIPSAPIPPDLFDDITTRLTDVVLPARQANDHQPGVSFTFPFSMFAVQVDPEINFILSPYSGPGVYNHRITVFGADGCPAYVPQTLEA